jgi:tetratricopeptide (TPR) repeat protein
MRVLFFLLLSASVLGQSALDKAKILYETKKYNEAIKILKGISEKSADYAAAQYYLGRASFDQKEYDDAADYFEEATETDPNQADYFNWLGNTYGTIAQNANMLKQGMLAPKMKKAWEKAIQLDAKNVDARTSLIQYYLQAPSFMGGSIEKAKEVAKQIIGINAAEGHRELANIYLHEKKTAEAEKELQEAAKANADYVLLLGIFYANQKQYDKAFALFEESIKKKPEDYQSLYQLGKTAALSGQRLDRGEVCLKKYLTHTPAPGEPSHGGAYMRLAQIKEKLGNKAEAKKLYETALKIEEDLKEAREGLERTSK